MKSPATALACLSIVCASHLTACSSGDTTGSGGTGGFDGTSAEAGPGSTTASTGATSGSTSATGGPGLTSASGTSSSTGGGDECSAKATYDECDECECTKNQAGCDAYGTLEMDSCYCGTAAPCAMACAASLCADAEPDAACNTCIEGLDEACYDAASTACAADAACSAYAAASESACANLPE